MHEQKQRISWVDTAKGLGIILVVFGHVLRGLINNDIIAWTAITRFVDAWIYSFHMPLFFFLSGMFLSRSMRKPWKEFAFDKIRTIAYPYFVWSLITIMIKSVLGSIVTHPLSLADSALVFYSPVDQFWFLYVLFVLVIAASGLLKLGVKPWLVVGVAILIYPGLLPIANSGLFVVIRIMAIYVAIGLFVGATWDVRLLPNTRAEWLVVCIAGGVILSAFGGWPALPYRTALQVPLAISGIGAVVALAVVIHKLNIDAALNFWGRHSLEIYLVHTIASAAVRIGLVKLTHTTDSSLHLLLGTFGGLFIPIALALLFEQRGIRFIFSMPEPKSRECSL